MKKMSFNAKRTTMAMVSIPYFVSIANYFAGWNFFGNYTIEAMALFGVLTFAHFFFIGPSISEIREYRQSRGLPAESRNAYLQGLPAKVKIMIIGFLALLVVLATINGFGDFHWLGRFGGEGLAGSVVMLFLALAYLRPQKPEGDFHLTDHEQCLKYRPRTKFFVLLNVVIVTFSVVAYLAMPFANPIILYDGGTIFQATSGLFICLNIFAVFGLKLWDGWEPE